METTTNQIIQNSNNEPLYNAVIENNANINNANIVVENEYVKKKYNVRKRVSGKEKDKDKDKEKKTDTFIMPTFSSHNTFLSKSFTVDQLKKICQFYKLKITGNKQILINKIYHHLFFSSYVVIIQRVWRKKYSKRIVNYVDLLNLTGHCV